MDCVALRRRAVALLAAYAVALQSLLAGVLAAGPSAQLTSFAVLCSHNTDSVPMPADHDWSCAALCAALGQGIAGAIPRAAVIALAEPSVQPAGLLGGDWVLPVLAIHGPQAPRAPPFA
jgi:hypothetical protein